MADWRDWRYVLDTDALSPKKKIERADEHISDLESRITELGNVDLYSVRIEKDFWYNDLHVEINASKSPEQWAPLVLGDAVHNLRSALDILYRQAVLFLGGNLTKHTKFPIVESAQVLARVLRSAGLKNEAGEKLVKLIRDEIKSYEGGNWHLCALNDLDVMDKHQFVIPVMELRALYVCLEDEKQAEIRIGPLITSKSHKFRLKQSGNLKFKSKSHAAAAILFPLGTPFEGQSVIPCLHQLSELASGVIGSFERVLDRKF
jgi:hypothetical protein